MIRFIKWYQRNISSITPSMCRYQPTCSNYMIIAIKKFGFWRGFIMGIARIIRCNPFVKGGSDPVPDYFTIFNSNKQNRKN